MNLKIDVSTFKYTVNDDYFSTLSLSTCYWGGFIAADGYVRDNSLQITVSIKDKSILDRFKIDIDSTHPINSGLVSNKYPQCNIKIRSRQICDDLEYNFNIHQRKSLTLRPPNIQTCELLDAYIVGYIDGDGSIGLYSKSKGINKVLSIRLVGTYEVCEFINNRFKTILNVENNRIYKSSKNSVKNTYQLVYTNKQARQLFEHYYNVDVSKLTRKWSSNIYEYVTTYSRHLNNKCETTGKFISDK